MIFAFVFPGQGSQSVGMLNSIASRPEVKATLQEASDALGEDVAKLIAEGPAEALSLTTNTQPVMLTAGVAFFRAWVAAGGALPKVMAGHSLGEYSALVAAGVISFKDAVPLVRFRAEAMQNAVPVGTGGMAAILGLDDAAVIQVCAQASDQSGSVVEAVNFNAPGQVVIAGASSAVTKACELLKAAGAKRALPLPVSAPFHSSLLKPASEKLDAYLAGIEFKVPAIAVINNVDVEVLNDPAAIKEALVRQAAKPVRWHETIQAMAKQGVTQVVECGPGKVLAGLTKRINDQLTGVPVFDEASLNEALAHLK
ncbi:ACP S-malonyltransferase [Polynucleobacter sphagniphilus]|jgi:[acyl-carrier-protein] S-malonyltransferase|uniref:Malonyl CoA-acyl carrier protein transacylase n=1 Tax=Polynucleobacter sphagniphilus TaxID=1743169 RepID=A0AA43M949_9BURK|nr:ACP S-malonyltransferase [Polynucleobacter sphagniphilus]MDF9787466.1 [acyl-carrier-protein] S-malonyltransferase [Polynucleobacter sphagniphilus]MDH6154159.1 [acyl-carrier-protein] S-malonyltransferase [Polynucleobacter sphagniphilus]MDH6240433.1 [acyl-carrier-protein] S-malonyltransferase [Polynucleobacter sphagniphilus]MDH6248266.1 [acyl-carrier-protein] S-malonyltransferase [Polynucleobacter sphagniphilus]MDH6299811.1 [acyl-carrier-protein] S-malonyltransferase [Polynucleobacter sphagni